MNCQRCESVRIVSINVKCNDMCSIDIQGTIRNDYPPTDMEIGGGGYIKFAYCLECGQMQGKFPLPLCEIEFEVEDLDDMTI